MIVYGKDADTNKYRAELERSVGLIRDRVTRDANRLPRDLFDQLVEFLDGEKRDSTVYLSVDPRPEKEGWGYTSGYCIWIRPRSFAPQDPNGTARLTPVLFHELVHAAGGWELDAEFFENCLFTPQEGATPPDDKDWEKFAATNYEGWWLYLDPPKSRRVVDLWKREIGEFILSAK